MDINQWLHRTVTAHDEDAPDDEQDENELIRERHSRRHTQRALSPAPVASALTKKPKTYDERRKHKRHASTSLHSSSSSSESSDSDCASQSSSSASDPSGHFERRKRHKTRGNLYEPHSGVRRKRPKKKDKDADDEKKKKKRHRRTDKKRKEARKPGQNLINNFSADNVRHDRLTLQPGASIGLFKKGRASSPVKRRGLPDLVFSEMNFLKKPREQPEASHLQDSSKERKKRNKRQDIENAEVSAFFSEKRPPLAAKGDNRKSTANTTLTCPSKSRSRTAAIPSVENDKHTSCERGTPRARSHSAKTILPEDSVTHVALQSRPVFNDINGILAEQHEQSPSRQTILAEPMLHIKGNEVGSKDHDRGWMHEQPNISEARHLSLKPAQPDKHHCIEQLQSSLERHVNKSKVNTLEPQIVPKTSRPTTSPVGRLLLACDSAMQQEQSPTQSRPYNEHHVQYSLPAQAQMNPRHDRSQEETQQPVSGLNRIHSAPQHSYLHHANQIIGEAADLDQEYDSRQYQHNLAMMHESAREYGGQPHDFVQYEHACEPYHPQDIINANDDPSHYAQQDAAHNELWQEADGISAERPARFLSTDLHRGHQLTYQPLHDYNHTARHDRVLHYNQDEAYPPLIQYGYDPERATTRILNNAYPSNAGAGGFADDDARRQAIMAEHGYMYVNRDEQDMGIEEELDYAIHGSMEAPEDGILDVAACEPSIVPDDFWRPRRLYQ